MVKTYDPLRAKARASVSVALSFVLGLGIASLFGFTDRPFGGFEIQTAPPVSDAEVQPALDLSEAFVNAAGAVTPAVVRIETSRTQTASGDRTGLEWFFRGQAPDPEIVQGSGSGFLIAENGYVLTNNHVVEDATSITVKMLDGREFGADIVGTDPTTDIAVIRVDGTGFPVASLGTSADVRVGEWVLAVHRHPLAVPRNAALLESPPGGDLATHRGGAPAGAVAAALVALDQPRGAQPRQADPHVVLGEAEERARLHQRLHGHRALTKRGEQVEDQAAGRRHPGILR